MNINEIRLIHNPPTLGDRLYLFKSKIINFLFRFKIIDTRKYNLIPINKRIFVLSDTQKQQAEEIYKKEGTLDYIFIPTEIGDIVKVRVRDSGKCYDITDYDIW